MCIPTFAPVLAITITSLLSHRKHQLRGLIRVLWFLYVLYRDLLPLLYISTHFLFHAPHPPLPLCHLSTARGCPSNRERFPTHASTTLRRLFLLQLYLIILKKWSLCSPQRWPGSSFLPGHRVVYCNTMVVICLVSSSMSDHILPYIHPHPVLLFSTNALFDPSNSHLMPAALLPLSHNSVLIICSAYSFNTCAPLISTLPCFPT